MFGKSQDISAHYDKISQLSFTDKGLVYLSPVDGDADPVEEPMNIAASKAFVFMRQCPNLKSLYLDENRLVSVSGINMLPGLVTLHVGGNLLTSIGDISDLANLEQLSLKGNQLSVVKGLDMCKQLRELDLSHQAGTGLRLHSGTIAALSMSLSYLSLAHNGLTSISDVQLNEKGDGLDPALGSILWLSQLTSLDLSGNSIWDLGEVVDICKACPYLQSLNLSGNPVSKLPKYRQIVVLLCPHLRMLDGKPLFERERAFYVGQRKHKQQMQLLQSQAAQAQAQAHQRLEQAQQQDHDDAKAGSAANDVNEGNDVTNDGNVHGLPPLPHHQRRVGSGNIAVRGHASRRSSLDPSLGSTVNAGLPRGSSSNQPLHRRVQSSSSASPLSSSSSSSLASAGMSSIVTSGGSTYASPYAKNQLPGRNLHLLTPLRPRRSLDAGNSLVIVGSSGNAHSNGTTATSGAQGKGVQSCSSSPPSSHGENGGFVDPVDDSFEAFARDAALMGGGGAGGAVNGGSGFAFNPHQGRIGKSPPKFRAAPTFSSSSSTSSSSSKTVDPFLQTLSTVGHDPTVHRLAHSPLPRFDRRQAGHVKPHGYFLDAAVMQQQHQQQQQGPYAQQYAGQGMGSGGGGLFRRRSNNANASYTSTQVASALGGPADPNAPAWAKGGKGGVYKNYHQQQQQQQQQQRQQQQRQAGQSGLDHSVDAGEAEGGGHRGSVDMTLSTGQKLSNRTRLSTPDYYYAHEAGASAGGGGGGGIVEGEEGGHGSEPYAHMSGVGGAGEDGDDDDDHYYHSASAAAALRYDAHPGRVGQGYGADNDDDDGS